MHFYTVSTSKEKVMRAKHALVRTIAGAVMLTMTVSLGVTNVAFADTGDTVTASEIATAVINTDATNGNLVAEPVPSATDADSAAVVQQNDTTTDVPKNPDDGIGIKSKDGTDITIGLPNAATANDAQRLSDGTVVYSGTDGSANAVIPTSDGVQILNTIANSDAPTRYNYNVSVPEGGKVEVVEGGGAQVVDTNGTGTLYIGAPWAKDKNGAAVPTHFEVEGANLIQVVDHNNGAFVYPVVADPRVYYSWGILTIKFSSAETGYISRAGGAAVGAYFGNVAGAFFGALGGDWIADVAASRGQCVVFRFVPWYVWAGGVWIENC